MLRRGLLALRGSAGAHRSLALQQRQHGMQARLLLKNAAQVVVVGGGSKPKLGRAMNEVVVLVNHSLLVGQDGRIAEIVPAGAATEELQSRLRANAAAFSENSGLSGVDTVMDCFGKVVLPGFVDGHTHAVFAGDRSHEHAMKLAGATCVRACAKVLAGVQCGCCLIPWDWCAAESRGAQ
jgi:imidazolonepropionase-like amidohydrolase